MTGTIAICVGLACGYLLALLVDRSALATARREATRVGLRSSDARARLGERMASEFRQDYQRQRQQSGRFMRQTTRLMTNRRSQIYQEVQFLDQQASQFDLREAELLEEDRQLAERRRDVARLAGKLERRREQFKQRLLERIGDRTLDQIDEIRTGVNKGIEDEVSRMQARRLDELIELSDLQARRIIGVAVGRCQVSHAHPLPSSLLRLQRGGELIEIPESFDLQGLIKALLDVDLKHDTEQHTLYISHADGVVREITRRAIEDLLEHELFDASVIEGLVARYREAVSEELRQVGTEVLAALGLSAVGEALTEPLGRLKYRTSFGQNILYHSIEVAYLCAAIGGEVGLDRELALRAGLFHDIGKVLRGSGDEGHPELGARLLAEQGEAAEVVEAARDHHQPVEKQPQYAALVCAADAISAARPGARRESFDQYVKRLERLEMIANSFLGVETAFAIQAGRELRVLVDPEEVDDAKARELAADIAREIRLELDFPGRVKVTLIREKRIVEYAR